MMRGGSPGMTTVQQWWTSRLPVTRLLVALTVIVSLSRLAPPRAFYPSAILSPFLPAWLLSLSFEPVEFLVGSFLTQLFDAGGLGFPLLINIFVLAQSSNQAELDVFYGFTNDVMYFPRQELFTEDTPASASGRFSPIVSTLRYVWFLFVNGAVLVAVDLFLVRVRGCLPMLLAYVWCRLQPATLKLSLAVVNAKVSVRSYPLLLAAIHFLMGQGLVSDVLAVLLGHLFCYTLHLRRRDCGEWGLRVFDVPLRVYSAVRQLHLRQFEQLRRQGRFM
jgi:hypothetical protein